MAPDAKKLLSLRAISKSFFGAAVLKSVSLNVREGKIVGLVGENGAGKSTLMNIIGGNVCPDEGAMVFADASYAPKTPRDAQSAGIAFVHQELNLFPNLTVAENLFLNNFPRQGPFIARASLRRNAKELLDRVGLEISPEIEVGELAAGERQLVEIARALSLHAKLLILDEPTTSLSAVECARLFALMRRFRGEGQSIVFISHALRDVLAICDEVVVLRDGELVGEGPAADFDEGRLVSLMVGRELKQLFPSRNQAGSKSAAPLLEVRNVTQRGVVRDVSFEVRPGEIVGVAGLMGAGRTELARILFGLDPHERGEILLGGQPLRRGPRRRIGLRMAMLTESRRDDGLCLEASVAENMALVTLPQKSKSPFRLLDSAALTNALKGIQSAVRLQPSLRLEQPARTLSGGNQQKVVLAKWLLADPQLLILDEPTRGIDVGAKFEIYQLILALADRGAGVLMISSEIEELIGLCERILVMSRGAVTGEFARSNFDREAILRAALAGHERSEAAP